MDTTENLKSKIEKFISVYDGTYIGQCVKNRYEKQQFNLEDLRVRPLNSIRNLELFITIAVGYVALIGEKSEEQLTAMQLISCSKRIYKANKFVLYAIADGMFAILSRYKQGINNFLILSTKSPNLQLSLPLLDFTS